MVKFNEVEKWKFIKIFTSTKICDFIHVICFEDEELIKMYLAFFIQLKRS